MGRSCVVCKSSYKNATNNSLFKVPADSEMFELWQRTIPGIELKKSHFICKMHFEAKYVLTKYVKHDVNGKIIAEVPYKHPRLDSLAVPTIFDWSSSSESLAVASITGYTGDSSPILQGTLVSNELIKHQDDQSEIAAVTDIEERPQLAAATQLESTAPTIPLDRQQSSEALTPAQTPVATSGSSSGFYLSTVIVNEGNIDCISYTENHRSCSAVVPKSWSVGELPGKSLLFSCARTVEKNGIKSPVIENVCSVKSMWNILAMCLFRCTVKANGAISFALDTVSHALEERNLSLSLSHGGALDSCASFGRTLNHREVSSRSESPPTTTVARPVCKTDLAAKTWFPVICRMNKTEGTMLLFTKDDERCTNPNKTLGIDEACLSILNNENVPARVFSVPDACWACDGLPLANLSANSNTTLVISTRYKLHMYYTANDLQYCHGSYQFVEHGHYGWNLTDGSCSSFYVLKEPSDPYIPILAMILVYVSIFAVTNILTQGYAAFKRARAQQRTSEQSDLATLQEPEAPAPPQVVSRSSTRIHSIDTFRGIAILMMIFVNNGGGKYVFFNHSPWYGLTVADLVLPWFAWIMGLTLVVSLRTQLRISVSRPRIVVRAWRRSMMLFLLGLIVNSEHKTTLGELRILGILQLLGITYFICATMEALFMKAQRNFQYGRFMFLQDILDCWPQWLMVAALVASHTLITFLLPVPGCPRGYLGPGGYDRRGKYANCTGGAAGYIDRLVLGNHIYNKTHNPIYGPVLPHDPEGIMNTLSAVLFVALGVQAGRILLCYYLQLHSKLVRWFSWAVVTGIVAGILCDWKEEGGVIPLSKNMMTISFVLATSSLAFLLFAILFYLIDHKRWWSGAPFVFAGANPIFLYVGHYLAMNHFPWTWTILEPTHAKLFYMNLWTTTVWGLIAYYLYRKNLIITI